MVGVSVTGTRSLAVRWSRFVELDYGFIKDAMRGPIDAEQPVPGTNRRPVRILSLN